MPDEIFYPARNHDAGPGMWWVKSSRVREWSYDCGGRKLLAYMMARILNDPDKYSDLDGYGISNMRWDEKHAYEHRDDLPPPEKALRESLMKTIEDTMKDD